MTDRPAAPLGWTSSYVSAEDFTFTVLRRKGSRLIREGEQPGQGVTRDELHNNVIAIAQERVGFKLSPAEQTRLMSYQKDLWSGLVGVASLADPVQSGDLEAMARRAVDALNQRARPGTMFVLTRPTARCELSRPRYCDGTCGGFPTARIVSGAYSHGYSPASVMGVST